MLPDISKLDDAVTMYEEQAEEWKSSSSFERDILTTFLKREILGHGHPSGLRLEVDTCVGIGLGTFTAKRDGRRDGPVEQLIAFKTMVEVLRMSHRPRSFLIGFYLSLIRWMGNPMFSTAVC